MPNFNKDYMILAVAIASGLIFLLPHVLSPILRGDGLYTPLVTKGVNFVTVDEIMYASNIRDVYDGHLIVKDSQIFENKHGGNILTPWFPYLILGTFTKLTGSVPNTYIISDFIFPVIIFLSIYLMLRSMTKNFLVSLMGGTGVLFGSNLLMIGSIPSILSNVSPVGLIKLPYFIARLPFVEVVFIPFILAVFMTYLALETGKKVFSVTAGILGGLLFYSYVYYMIGFSIGLGVLFFIQVLRKDIQGVKQAFIIGVITVAIGSVFIVNMLNLSRSQDYLDIISKSGIYFGRFNKVFIIKTLFYGLLLSSVTLIVRKKNNAFLALFSFFSAGLIGLNLQIITGYNIQPDHYWVTILQPVGVILLAFGYNEIFSKKNTILKIGKTTKGLGKYSKSFLILLIAMLTVHGLLMNIGYSLNTHDSFSLAESQMEMFDWLDKNTEVDDVVLTLGIENNILVPVYTHNNVFLPNGLLTSTTSDEVMERVYISYKLLDVSSAHLEKNLENKYLNDSLTGYLYSHPDSFDEMFWTVYLFHFRFEARPDMPKDIYLNQAEGLDPSSIRYVSFIPDDFREEALDEYENYPDKIEDYLGKYRLDYVIIGPYERSVGTRNLAELGFESVWSNGEFEIYKISAE